MWTILQLADSAFPTGGFAHSGGLEAAVQGGVVARAGDVERFCAETLVQCARGALPMVGHVWDTPAEHSRVDALATAVVWSHVASRASRAQGRALLESAARAFGDASVEEARGRARSGEIAGHLAPAFGLVTRRANISRKDAYCMYIHLAARGVLSAAVRLGLIGPGEAQATQHRLASPASALAERALTFGVDDIAQTAPVIEVLQGTQDRLYSRLFQS